MLIGVCLHVLFEVLGTFEFLAAGVTNVWLERDMHANVRGDVIALDGSSATAAPATGEVEVVGGAAADVNFAHMILYKVRLAILNPFFHDIFSRQASCFSEQILFSTRRNHVQLKGKEGNLSYIEGLRS